MKRRVFWSIMLTSLLIFSVTVTVVMATVYNEFANERKDEIQAETTYIAEGYNHSGLDYLKQVGLYGKHRITFIAPDGTVLYDSAANEASMENHLERPEISSALQYGTGKATRTSDTLAEKTYYYATKLSDGSVLRVAAPIKSILKIVDNTATYILLIMLFIIVLAVFTARILTKRIVAPLNNMDLESPLENDTYEEFSPLMVRIDKQNKQLAQQMEELSAKQREFSEITDGMSEALVVFSSDRKILSCNRSAKRLFSLFRPEGLGYLELCRDPIYIGTVECAFNGEKASEKFRKNGRIYRLSADPVGDQNNFAAILSATDITDSERAEQMRREFSANVSHELKTPLTSILGCAEIIQN